ncbi:Hypothetical protein R9X50_00786500 [Acrodontium crateriforme]|uniref:Uncharacterized protein n=1 Tax=Acrodontium crateriforme TaxID=150365 RepID=A0AAQ3ME74_9PEZI|nr:Hypothetical protein R9X50_00786500 [Acrodontium crateriforme]
MADTTNPEAAATAPEETEQQITFTVKSSADSKYVVTVPTVMTIADLKHKLSTSEYAGLPPDRQRLIYSGRVLKDVDTVASCKIKENNTVHLVRGAESNSRQNPANQGGAATNPAANVPTNIAAGTAANDPLAQLTGARYAGMHGLPGMDTFGADGGMGAPPNPEAMLRMLDDPNVAQQMTEAMNNPAVLNMMRNHPQFQNNPMLRAALDNPELRRMIFDPNMIRMQMRMQQAMGGGDGAGSFPMPGQTDTTTQQGNGAATGTGGQANTGGSPPPAANPFASLFGGAGQAPGARGDSANAQAQDPFAGLFGGAGLGAGAGAQGNNPLQAMSEQLMQNPEMMRQAMQMLGGGAGGANPFGGLGAGGNPWAGLGGFGGAPEPQQPADDRPPEERYESQLRQLNDMGFFEFERNVQALRRSGGSVQGAIEYLLQG